MTGAERGGVVSPQELGGWNNCPFYLQKKKGGLAKERQCERRENSEGGQKTSPRRGRSRESAGGGISQKQKGEGLKYIYIQNVEKSSLEKKGIKGRKKG